MRFDKESKDTRERGGRFNQSLNGVHEFGEKRDAEGKSGAGKKAGERPIRKEKGRKR